MTVLYVVTPGAVVHKRSHALVVKSAEGEMLEEVELARLQSIVVLNTVQVTTQALSQALAHGVELAIVSRNGKLLGQLTPPLAKNIDLRKRQYDRERDPVFALRMAKEVVNAKVHNQREVLVRFSQDEPGSQPEAESAIAAMKSLEPSIGDATGLAELRGIEGSCARAYWSAFGSMFKVDGVKFPGRRQHPSPDPVNAVLSFGYVLLGSYLHSLLDGLGFDPFLGFFHVESYGRPSLALDLLEPFRAPIIDRFVVRLFNLRMVGAEDFEDDGEGGMRLKGDAIRVFFREYEKALHRARVRELVKEQAENMRRVFLGEADSLNPFTWSSR